MLTTHPFDDDKLREECGIFGVWGADSAANLVALGLHALQHRGQEAAGITTSDGTHFHSHRAMGHVAGTFDRDDIVRKLAGRTGIGHVRYSTTGETALRNVQPLFAELASGGFAVAHNGNLSNALKLRRTLNRRGSIFQSTGDTEVIIHLAATSDYSTTLDRLTDALKQVEGAYSLLVLTEEGLIACRDPLGIRPLVMGKLGEATIFASESVALDVIGATFLRDVEPGELVLVNDSGIRSFSPFDKAAPRPCVFEHVYFSRPDSIADGQSVYRSGRRSAASLRARRRSRRTTSFPFPIAESRRRSAFRRPRQSRSSSGSSARIMSGGPSSSRARTCATSASSSSTTPIRRWSPASVSCSIDDSIVRGTTSVKIVQMMRDAGAREVHMRIASPPTKHSCFSASTRPSAPNCSRRR